MTTPNETLDHLIAVGRGNRRHMLDCAAKLRKDPTLANLPPDTRKLLGSLLHSIDGKGSQLRPRKPQRKKEVA